MFENYKVAVKVALVNEVSAGLLLIAKQFGTADAAAKAYQKRLNAIKDTAKGGAMLLGGSMAIAAPFIYAIDKAAQLQKQMIGVQVATRGTAAEMDSMRKSIEDIASQTVFSNIDVSKMAKTIASGTGLGAKDVQKLLPEYARFADVQLLMKGTSYESSITDAIRLAHTAGKYDPASLSKYLDVLTKASFIVPGGLGEVGHALKYSQGMGKAALGIDDEQMVLMTALLNRLGFAGSRGGTNLIAAMSRDIPGVFGSGLLKGKSGEALSAMGMVDAKGHAKAMKGGKFDMFMWMGELSEYIAREMASHPENIARENIMKNFQHAYGTQGARVASLLADPQAMQQLTAIGQLFQQFGGTDAVQKKFADESTAQQWMNAKTNFVSAMTELGITLLPMASSMLKKFNHEMQGMIKWMTENPGKVKALSYAFLGLSAAMAFGGTVLLLKSGFKGIGLAMEIGGGMAGRLTGVATGLGAVTAAAGYFMAAYAGWKLGEVIGDKIDRNVQKSSGYGLSSMRDWLAHTSLGKSTGMFNFGQDESLHFVQAPSQRPIQVHTEINMDGFKIAHGISKYQAKAAGFASLATGTDFDMSRSVMPVAGSWR